MSDPIAHPADEAAAQPIGKLTLPLLERDDHLTALTTAVGSGRMVLVSGEAGIGKTTLLRAFVARVAATTRVWWGGCDPLATPIPLGPLHDIAASGTGTSLAALLDRGETRDALFNAFLDHLRQPRGVAVIEDAHWADEATLDLLRFVGRRIDRTRGLLVVTWRTDEVDPGHPLRLALGDVPRAATIELQLPGLSEGAVAALAHRAGRTAAGLHAASGGNPFFVTEILASETSGIPVTVRDAVLARAARLTPEARDVLRLVSVSPGPIERWLIDALALPAQTAVEECLATGMLRAERCCISFRHELARLALREGLSPHLARTLHGQVLRALEARAPDALGRLAHHAAGAGDGEAVLRYALPAARQAERFGAHREAAAHYAAALAWASDLPPADRAELLERRAFESYLTEEIPEALEARRASLAIWRQLGDSERAGDTLRWISRLHWFLGQRADAERYAVEAVETLEAVSQRGSALAMAYSNRSQLAMLALDDLEAMAWGTRAIVLAGLVGDREALAHALNNVGTARIGRGEAEGREQIEESLRLSLEQGWEEHAARAYCNLIVSPLGTRAYFLSERFVEEGIDYCRAHDLDSFMLYIVSWRARLRLDRGAWSAAEDDATYVLAHRRLSPVSRIQALAVLGLLRARRGDPDSAALLDEAERLALPTGEPQRIGQVAVAQAEAAWIRGDADGVARAADVAVPTASLAVQWDAAALGQFLGLVGRPAASSGGLPQPYRCLVSGNWRGAAAVWASMGCPYERALALAAGDDPAATREAVRLLRELGATGTLAAITRDQRSRGVRGTPRGPRPATRVNPAGLTHRQVEVLALLSAGLRNAEIAERLAVSPRTADHHVSAILAKLGARSRLAAAAAARELGVLSPRIDTQPRGAAQDRVHGGSPSPTTAVMSATPPNIGSSSDVAPRRPEAA